MSSNIRLDTESSKYPLINWMDSYAAYQLDDNGSIVDLGKARGIISKEDVKDKKDVIILSERSGGTRSLLNWWCRELDQIGRPWILVNADNWSSNFFENSKIQTPPGIEEAVNSFGTASSATSRAKALSSVWAGKHTEFTLIIRDITALDTKRATDDTKDTTSEVKKAVDAAIALRRLRDHNLCPGLQVIITSPREDIFMEKPNFSGYRHVADEFRPPYFDAREVDLLVKGSPREKPRLSLTSEAKRRFMDHTGGHPLVVQRLLRRLRELAQRKRKKELGLREVERAAKEMRESPPTVVSFWQDDLRRFFKEEPALVDRMKGYVMGTKTLGRKNFPPPGDERSLFFGGWLSLNENNRWGITSRFHAHLAWPVIDEFNRG